MQRDSIFRGHDTGYHNKCRCVCNLVGQMCVKRAADVCSVKKLRVICGRRKKRGIIIYNGRKCALLNVTYVVPVMLEEAGNAVWPRFGLKKEAKKGG
jgi:hypothetical protein